MSDMQDVLLILREDTLECSAARLELVKQAASLAKHHILILLDAACLANADSIDSFEAVQKLLSSIYTQTSVVLAARGELLLPVDVVIDSLRARNDTAQKLADTLDYSAFQHVMQEEEEATVTSAQVTKANGPASIALGGTFDHLHSGHKILLTMAAWLATRRVIVGITDEPLLQKKSNKHLLESLDIRRAAVKSFFDLVAPWVQVDLPALQDVFGPTATDPDIQGLIVSEESIAGAEAIDKERIKNQLSPLRCFVIQVISPEALQDSSSQEQIKLKLGSTAIRAWIAERQTVS